MPTYNVSLNSVSNFYTKLNSESNFYTSVSDFTKLIKIKCKPIQSSLTFDVGSFVHISVKNSTKPIIYNSRMYVSKSSLLVKNVLKDNILGIKTQATNNKCKLRSSTIENKLSSSITINSKLKCRVSTKPNQYKIETGKVPSKIKSRITARHNSSLNVSCKTPHTRVKTNCSNGCSLDIKIAYTQLYRCRPLTDLQNMTTEQLAKMSVMDLCYIIPKDWVGVLNSYNTWEDVLNSYNTWEDVLNNRQGV